LDIPAGLLPGTCLWSAAVLYVLLLCLALLSAPWSKILDNEASHVYFGAIAMIVVLWMLRGGIRPGLGYHLLGATLLCLMFDWQFALIALGLVLVFATWQGPAGWEALGVNALVMGVLPVLFTRIFLYACQRWLPHNFFIYIFINAFLAGAVSVLLAGLASAWIQALAGVHAPGSISADFLLILPLLMFGEGFLNGALMSLLVAYRPRWVATFHDRWYLHGK
jgi:uncharacterized membrane protein